MQVSNQSLKFHSEALGEDALLVLKLSGEERLTGLFRFELELLSTDPSLDLDAALYQPAKVGILQRLGPDQSAFRWFQGTLTRLEEHDQGHGWVTYRAVLVPDLWRLSMSWRSRVYQSTTIDELVGEVLKGGLGLQRGVDFDWKLSRTKPGERKARPVYPEREYVVQYKENDLDFIQRWLEHEGIWYLFENDGEREKVLFADSSAAYQPVDPSGSAYPYRPEGSSRSTGGGDGKQDAEDVLVFRGCAVHQPSKVVLDDYNWRDPSVSLKVEKEVHADGTGVQLEYNNHYKTPDQGRAHAEVRSQEWACRKAQFWGESTCRGFRPGRTFTLDEHFRSDWNRKYLLIAVTHKAEQSINLEASNVTAADYKNGFECLAADQEFRPERTVSWPSIQGVTHARIDGEGDGGVAELDALGRYKVRLPWDERARDAAAGKASRWIRMAQPYAGPGSGFHFPLLKGTEVLLIHIDGDPDRPIIAGAVPDHESISPTTHLNPTQNKIQTPSGSVLQIDDHQDRNGFVFLDANRSFVQDFRRAGDGSGEGGQGGGQGGARRRRRATPPGELTPEARERLERLRSLDAAGVPPEARREAFKELLGIDRPDPGSVIERLVAGGKPLPGVPIGPGSGKGGDVEEWIGNLPLLPNPSNLPRPSLVDTPPTGATTATPTDTQLAQDEDEEEEWSTSILEYLNANTSAAGLRSLIETGISKLEPHEPNGKAFTTDYQLWARRFDAFMAIAWTDGVGEVTINNCNQYTYVDNSMEAKITTGGTSYDECLGDETTYEIKHKNQTEDKKNYGDATSSSLTIGNETKLEVSLGTKTSTTIEVSGNSESKLNAGTKTFFELNGAAEAGVKIDLAAKAELNVTLAAEAALNITVGPKVHIDLEAGVDLYFKLAASPAIDLQIAVEDIELKIPDSSEVRLKKIEAALDNTLVELNKTENALLKTRNELKETKNQLDETKNQLNQTSNQLQKTETQLSNKITALDAKRMGLALDTVALKRSVATLQNAQTAALHTIS